MEAQSSSWIIEATLLTLLGMSVITWTLALVKWIGFSRERSWSRRFLKTYWQSPDWSVIAKMESLNKTGDTGAVADTVRGLTREYAHETGYSFEQMQDTMTRGLNQKIQSISRARESWLGVLASIGSTAPFVGLFGTVWGIMEALIVISATGEATIAVVAGPIGEALIATAVGIVTAIPAVMFFNYFTRRIRVRITKLEGFAEEILRFALRHRAQWRQA